MKLDAEQLKQLIGIVKDAAAYANHFGGRFENRLVSELETEMSFTVEPDGYDWRLGTELEPSEGRVRGQK